MSAPVAVTPLGHRRPLAGDGIALAERTGLGLLTLRGAHAVLVAATGLPLPARGPATGVGDGTIVLTIGPDEWLLVLDDVPAAAARLGAALAETHHQLVDVADAFAAIDVGGPQLRSLLAKLVAIDLHPRAFRAGEAVATLAGHLDVRLWLPADDRATLFVRRSAADHLWCLLAEAGREWGLPPQTPRR